MAHPECGLYRTAQALDSVPAGRLVYFHNHGNPGAGIYLPKRWVQNRAEFQENGLPVPSEAWSASLIPLLPEGLYRVREPFTCCEKQCHRYEAEALVQLGYNGEGQSILFVPEFTAGVLQIPERGTAVNADRLARLTRLTVPERTPTAPAGLLH